MRSREYIQEGEEGTDGEGIFRYACLRGLLVGAVALFLSHGVEEVLHRYIANQFRTGQ